MNQIISFAQKGIVLDQTKTRILAIKYLASKYNPEKANGKLGLPGGQIEFGEDVDESLIREVEEETGLTVVPSTPLHVYSWIYKKDDAQKQIIAVARIAYHKSGEIKEPIGEKETTLEKAQWIDIKDINIDSFIIDEQPILEKFLKYYPKYIGENS